MGFCEWSAAFSVKFLSFICFRMFPYVSPGIELSDQEEK